MYIYSSCRQSLCICACNVYVTCMYIYDMKYCTCILRSLRRNPDPHEKVIFEMSNSFKLMNKDGIKVVYFWLIHLESALVGGWTSLDLRRGAELVAWFDKHFTATTTVWLITWQRNPTLYVTGFLIYQNELKYLEP